MGALPTGRGASPIGRCALPIGRGDLPTSRGDLPTSRCASTIGGGAFAICKGTFALGRGTFSVVGVLYIQLDNAKCPDQISNKQPGRNNRLRKFDEFTPGPNVIKKFPRKLWIFVIS
jgi:hypothetical protein